jgi:hypothetical protein
VLPLGGRVRLVLAAGPDETLLLVAEVTPEALAGLGCHEGQLLNASFKATAISVSNTSSAVGDQPVDGKRGAEE